MFCLTYTSTLYRTILAKIYVVVLKHVSQMFNLVQHRNKTHYRSKLYLCTIYIYIFYHSI